MQFGSHIAVPVLQPSSCSSNSTPGLRTSICHRFGSKEKKDEAAKGEFVLGSFLLITDGVELLPCVLAILGSFCIN